MRANTLKSEKLGKMPVGKLLAVMSLPAMLSMFVQSMYNVVDSIFVSQISNDAITALALAFPIQIILVAFAIGIGVGTNSLISRRLGECKNKEASLTAKNGLVITLIAAAVFSLCGLFFAGNFIAMFTTNLQVMEMGTQYLTIVTAFSVFFFIEILLTKTLQATGNMIIPMVSQLIGAAVNIILDPILIFGLFGFAALGIKGAAIATVIGQAAALLFTVIMFKTKKHDVNFSFKGFKINGKIMLNILAVGIPAIVINSIASFVLITFNRILKDISEYGIPVLGIYFKLQSFVFMPIFGLSQGAMPIMGYNFGARNKKRFLHAYKLTLAVAMSIAAVGTIIFQFFPHSLLQMFNANVFMTEIGVTALRTISLCILPASFAIVITTLFQSVGHGLKSLIMTLTRQLGLLIPLALILSKPLGLNGIWISFPIAEIVTVFLFIPVAVITVSKLFNNDEKQMLLKTPAESVIKN